MNEYIIRNAIKDDLPFLADTVIAAEKGVSDKCNYSTLFNLSERKSKALLYQCLKKKSNVASFLLKVILLPSTRDYR
jgi:hypothetical protein